MMLNKRWFLVPLCLLAFCSNDEVIQDNMPLSKLYALGVKQFNATNYEKAVEFFSALEQQYPYSDLTVDAQLLIGLSHYMNAHYTEGRDSFDAFITMHPHHPEVPYALYMKGLCVYSRVSFIERDQSMAQEAFLIFKELLQRFPNSPYTQDANLKIQQMLDHISAAELNTARYNEKNHLYHAALARLERVSPLSIHYPESLFRRIECYKGIGQDTEAEIAKQKLLKEFPENNFAKKIPLP